MNKLFFSGLFIISITLQGFCIDPWKIAGDIFRIAYPVAVGTKTVIDRDTAGLISFAASYSVTLGITVGLKYLVKKDRPNHKDFYSFPSGHTSSVFSSTTFAWDTYGWKIGLPALAGSILTGYSRIESQHHFLEDVLAGAFIGYVSTEVVSKKFSHRIHVSPQVNNGEYGLVLSACF